MSGRPAESDRPRALRTAAQLVADIERRIASGLLAPGDRLAPVRATADELDLAPNTVAAAYRTLGERGLVVGDGRRGTFVAARPAVAATADEPVPDGLVDLTTGNPDPAFLPPLAPALARIPTRPVLYGEPTIAPELAALLRADLTADGIAADHLAVVAGALDGLERVLTAHLRTGDKVAVEDPGYAPVTELILALGLRPVPLPVDPAGPTPDGLAAALGAGVAAVVITPRAQNPTGAALDADRAAALGAVLATAPGVLTVEDDHAGPVAGSPFHSVTGTVVGTAAGTVVGPGIGGAGRERWAVVRSVAKSLGPDLRLAALTGDERTVQRVAGRQLLGPGWVPHLLQRVVVELLSDPAVPALLARASAAYAERRGVVVDTLTAGGLVVEARSGMNVWVPVLDEAQVVAGMARRGFAVRSGARYRQVAGPGIRLSSAGAEPEVLRAAAAALLEVTASRPRSRSV